ncbi:MAG TPA: hypothetical protein DCY20_02240 [Firmicutes bacterium]|nr:hypothetical protein [Bacillota bacterium]
MKKLLTGLLSCLCVLALVGCYSQDEKSYEGLDEYENLSKNPVVQTVKFDQAKSLLTEGSGVLILSYSACPWCQSAMPVVDEVAKELSLDHVYYLNVKELTREGENNEYDQLVELLRDHLVVENGEPVMYVPDVFAVKQGEIVGHHLGTTDEHDANEREMTDAEKEELVKIYTELFNKTK